MRERLEAAGHSIVGYRIVKDEPEMIDAALDEFTADPGCQALLFNGGTGIARRDTTFDVIARRLEKTLVGFGELFRQVSYDEIGASTIQSRAVGGLANATLIFALPGSGNAVRTGWEKILHHQLDATYKPCNFVELFPRLRER